MNFKLIKDYYLIGGLYSAALVSKDASIDWLCLPNFDSPSIFAKILDEKAGSFSLKLNDYKITSNYLDETAIVEFNIESKNLKFTLRDFMLPSPEEDKKNHFLVRKISAIKWKRRSYFSFSILNRIMQNPNRNFKLKIK